MLTRSLVGEIIARFEKRGFKLVALKLNQPSKEQLEKHYADLKDKPFFPSLIKYSECLFSDPSTARRCTLRYLWTVETSQHSCVLHDPLPPPTSLGYSANSQCSPAPSSAWSGRASTPSRPAVPCSVPPTPSPPLPELSVATLRSRLELTSVSTLRMSFFLVYFDAVEVWESLEEVGEV